MLSFSHSFFSLSCTLQDTGGVGALLAVIRDGEAYAPAYDANGNVSEYIQLSAVQTDNYPSLPIAGGIVAHYEYSPFGEITAQSGGMADGFPFRFSTKPYCAILGKVEFELRIYAPPTGGWLNRDLIEEEGGLSLYGFCENTPINKWDYLGMDDCIKESIAISVHGAHFGGEGAFDGRAKKSGGGKFSVVNTGEELLNELAKKSEKDKDDCCHCIKALTIHSHASPTDPYNGIIMSGNSGFYVKKLEDQPEGTYTDSARDVDDLKASMDKKGISFCESCTITLFGCWTGAKGGIAEALSNVTSCKIIAPAGTCYPGKVKVKTSDEKEKETGKAGSSGAPWMQWEKGRGTAKKEKWVNY